MSEQENTEGQEAVTIQEAVENAATDQEQAVSVDHTPEGEGVTTGEEHKPEDDKPAEEEKKPPEPSREQRIHALTLMHLNTRGTTYRWPFPATERYLEVLHDTEFQQTFVRGVQGNDEDLSIDDFITRLNAFNESGRMPKSLDVAKNLGTEKLRKEISKKPNDVLWLRGLVAVALAEVEDLQANPQDEEAEEPTTAEVEDETTDETPQEIEDAAQEETSAA